MHHMDEVFTIWPTTADMARDIGVNPITARHWRRRKSIPAWYDAAIVDAAKRRGAKLTFEDLARARSSVHSTSGEVA